MLVVLLASAACIWVLYEWKWLCPAVACFFASVAVSVWLCVLFICLWCKNLIMDAICSICCVARAVLPVCSSNLVILVILLWGRGFPWGLLLCGF